MTELKWTPDRLSDRELVLVALYRMAVVHAGDGFSAARSVQTRLAVYLDRDRSCVSRVLDGATLSPEARARLLEHVADPEAHPLPGQARQGRPPGTGHRQRARAAEEKRTVA